MLFMNVRLRKTECSLNVILMLTECKNGLKKEVAVLKLKIIMFCFIFAIVVLAIVGIASTDKPYAIVMTFHNDASSSRAFTWRSTMTKEEGYLRVSRIQLELDDVEKIKATREIVQGENGREEAIFKAEATGLAPNTQYWYEVGTDSPGGWSRTASFVTGPADENIYSVSFIHVTDSQGEKEEDFQHWSRTLDQAAGKFPDAAFILHTGDMTENPDDPAGWRYFFDSASSVLSRLPLMPVTGNHEEVDNDAREFLSRFILPENGISAKNKGPSYSFDYGPIHIAVMNTESDIGKQKEWLDKDLAASDKEWRIVAMHRPAYGGNMYDKVEEWVEVFDKYKVDLVLQGHNHEYSRSYPLRGGKVTGDGDDPVRNRAGTVYVVPNTTGPKFNEKKDDQFYHKVHMQNYKQMFGGVSLKGKTLTYEAYDVDGQLVDKFVLEH